MGMLKITCGRDSGFSLTELAVTLAITTIIALLALPAATEGMLKTGVENTVGQVIALSGFARTEALRRGTSVVVCGAQLDASNNLSNCNGSTNWSKGVLVFQDLNLNNEYNPDERIKFIQFDNGVNVISNQPTMTVSPNDVDQVNNLVICIGKSFTSLGRYFSQQVRLSSYTASVICSRTDNATCNGC